MSSFLVTACNLLKNKKLKSPMLAVMGLAVIASSFVIPHNKAHALTSSDSQYNYSVLDDGTVRIDEYLGTSTNVVIPDTINGKKVTKIGDVSLNNSYSPFMGKSLKSVVIPDSVTEIGRYAFNANQLTSVKLPKNLVKIGTAAFYQNVLQSVTIPNKVTDIEDIAFSDNKLTKLNLGGSVQTIGENAFFNNKLTSVIIPNSVTSLGGYSFDNNFNLSKFIVNNYGVYFQHTYYNDSTGSANGTDTLGGNTNVTIYGYPNSTAEDYSHADYSYKYGFAELTGTLKDAIQAVEQAETTKNATDINTAQGLVTSLDDGEEKTSLQDLLDQVNEEVTFQNQAILDATNAVSLAESTKTLTDFNTAQTLVNALPSSTDKTALQNRLNALQDAINKQVAEQNATEAVVQAESSKSQADVDSAKTLVNALPDGTVKTDLTNRLNTIQDAINAQKAITDATNAVVQAETTQTQADVDTATILVNALPDGTVKTDLTNRLNTIQNDIDKVKVEQEATNAVEKAESSKTQADVDSARTLVNALPDGTVKDDLTNRLDTIQDGINKATAEQNTIAEQKAKEAVAKAEDSQVQADVNSAKTLVNALPDSIVKEDLINRLDAVQEAIDKSSTSTGSANGETTLAGTPLKQNISIIVKGGDLSLKNSTITPFKEIELGDTTKTVSTDFTAPFTVKDLTGNQLGYRVDVSASQLTDGTNTLPKGTLSLKPVSKIERVEIGMGEKPVSKLPNNQILDDGTSTLISANEGEGMGVFDLTFPDNALSLNMNPTTTKIDGDSTVYTSTITWDLIQAP